MEQQSEQERKKIDAFFSAHFTTGVLPPFSFTYGGKSSSEFLKDWQFSQETKRSDDKKTEHLMIRQAHCWLLIGNVPDLTLETEKEF